MSMSDVLGGRQLSSSLPEHRGGRKHEPPSTVTLYVRPTSNSVDDGWRAKPQTISLGVLMTAVVSIATAVTLGGSGRTWAGTFQGRLLGQVLAGKDGVDRQHHQTTYSGH